MKIADLFQMMAKHNASDLHIKAGEPPVFRVAGQLARMQNVPPLTPKETEDLLLPLMDDRQRAVLADQGYEDFAYHIEGVGRFRCNLFRQLGMLSAAVRRVNLRIPSYEELRLPPQVARCAEFEQGLILIGGVTGSGKSTTIASILNDINAKRRCHILTIEDPVEFVFKDDKAIINQREIHIDVKDFKSALRSAVREDPDVMLVGESCTAELIQDQPGSLAMGMSLPIPIVPLELPAYSKKENWGASETFYHLVRTLLLPLAPAPGAPPRESVTATGWVAPVRQGRGTLWVVRSLMGRKALSPSRRKLCRPRRP